MTARVAILLALAVLFGAFTASPSPATPAPARTGTSPPPPRTPAGLTMRPRPSAHGGFVDDMDCSACHTEAGWGLASSAGASGFDHDRTGFPLRGVHRQAGCGRCHTGQAKPATTCEGCHRDPHHGRHDGTCAECHTAVAWSDTSTLEQHRRTRMPLTGRHALVDCSACHKRQGERAFGDTPTDCYSCHRAEYRADPNQIHHEADGSGQFSRECGTCHRTSSWSPAFTIPNTSRTTMAIGGRHDAVFVLSTGSHRAAECSACHVDTRRTRLVRCDGCHLDSTLRAQHRSPVSRAASACLGCHPRGAGRGAGRRAGR